MARTWAANAKACQFNHPHSPEDQLRPWCVRFRDRRGAVRVSQTLPPRAAFVHRFRFENH